MFKSKKWDGFPDPADVDPDCRSDVVRARVAAGLLPFPSLPLSHKYNTVAAVCSRCGVKIYQGTGMFWSRKLVLCKQCLVP